jgi:hypothetical protein
VTRYIVHGESCSYHLVINPCNFRTIEALSWPGHVETFFHTSPLAVNVSAISILRLLERHSSLDNFTVLNEFPSTPHLQSLCFAPAPISFLRGDPVTGMWIGDRSDTAVVVGFEVYTPEQRATPELDVSEFDGEGVDMNDDDENNGCRSEPESDGLDPATCILISCLDKDKTHPVVKNVLGKHPRRVKRNQQVPGFSTVAVKFGRHDEERILASIDTALEPMKGRHLHSSWSPTMVMRCSHLYRQSGWGFLVVFSTAVTPALVYGTIGAVEMAPVGKRTVYVVLPGVTTDNKGASGGDSGEGSTGKMGDIVRMLKASNDLAVANGLPPPFEAVMRDHASEVHWLVKRAAYEAAPPEGGGFIYIKGWDVFCTDAKLALLLQDLGAVRGAATVWFRKKGLTGSTELLRVCVQQLGAQGSQYPCPQGVEVYCPLATDTFERMEDAEEMKEGEDPKVPFVLSGDPLRLAQLLALEVLPIVCTPRQAKQTESARKQHKETSEAKAAKAAAQAGDVSPQGQPQGGATAAQAVGRQPSHPQGRGGGGKPTADRGGKGRGKGREGGRGATPPLSAPKRSSGPSSETRAPVPPHQPISGKKPLRPRRPWTMAPRGHRRWSHRPPTSTNHTRAAS